MTRTQKKRSFFSKIVTKFRQLSNFPITHRYKDFSIKLPANHMLPNYKRAHPKYDRFLPHLVKYITQSDTVVDVGANVGDTLAGMAAQNPLANYICIEPDDYFYRHLEKNIERIKVSINSLNVQSIKALVGKNISDVSLDGNGGTKHAVIGDKGGITSLPLDEIISHATSVRVLKSDVDGFDYDVLDSSMSIIELHKPIIFFECQYDNEHQRNGYAKTVKSLETVGYCDWAIFDNFGELLIRTDSLDIVNQLINYIWQQNIGKATRTIYYYDILAAQKKDSVLISKVLEEYS